MALATLAVWALVAFVALVACVALVALVACVALSALVACVAFTALVAFAALVALSAVFACFTPSEGASFLTSVVSAFASLCLVRTILPAAYDVPPSARNSAISEITNAGPGALNLCLNIGNLGDVESVEAESDSAAPGARRNDGCWDG